MKKVTLFLIAVFIIISNDTFAQRHSYRLGDWTLEKKEFKMNEVKLNLPLTVLGLYPEVSYERLLQEDLSVGVAAGFLLNRDRNDHPMTFSIIPNVRWFFGGSSKSLQKYAAGFFIEANGAVFGIKDVVYDGYYESVPSKSSEEIGLGLGLGLGWKYVSRNNWVGEILLGGGRNLASEGAYPRFGISIGKRF